MMKDTNVENHFYLKVQIMKSCNEFNSDSRFQAIVYSWYENHFWSKLSNLEGLIAYKGTHNAA